MKRTQLFNLSAIAAFFLTAALANAQISFTGPYVDKSGSLAQDVMNSLYQEFVNDGSSTAETLALHWASETDNTNFLDEFEALYDSLGSLQTSQEKATAITAFVHDTNNFDANGLWIGTSSPSVNPLTPVVSNVSVAQVAGTKNMEIFYDLAVEDSNPCTVTVLWSTDNGETYPLTATAVTGSAGAGINPGVGLKITWDMSVDWDNQFTQTGRIKVVASRDPINRTGND